MGIVSTGALYDVLRHYRLLSSAQLAELPHLAQGRRGDPRALAKVLIQRGWLSIFQANEIFAGNTAELAFGPYLVLNRLGKGGLSQVYKARHAEQGWVVALKVLCTEALEDEPGRRQFMQEMEAMAEMDHPHVVQFCDVDQSGGTFYFAMEFVEGVDLGKQVALSGALGVREACEYVRQTALGLQHAHERNIVHRDIKPVNLFLTHVPVLDAGRLTPRKKVPTKPNIKIIDWGLAAWRYSRTSPDAAPASSSGGIVGTADYLSPEQAQDGDAVDIRGDLYSLGCSFYFLLTGQAPFPQGNLAQKLMAHKTQMPRAVDEFRSDVPAEVIRILTRLLAKDPAKRFQTPAALALALQPFTRAEMPANLPQTLTNRPLVGGPRRDDTPLPGALRREPGAAARKQQAPRQ